MCALCAVRPLVPQAESTAGHDGAYTATEEGSAEVDKAPAYNALPLGGQEDGRPSANAASSGEDTACEIPGQNYTVPEPARADLGIPGADHELTEKFRKQYLSESGRKFLVSVLEASAPYRPYIRQRLSERGMPLFIQYLPVVESNFKTNAVSSTGATGMWQFMENSMAPFLKKDSWYDERLDPWLSTDAALAKLTDNYKMFGDWALALAAYNCGAGALSRILRQNPGATFWQLAEKGRLRDQTKNYVPKLLAIADIIENAEHYGALEVHLAAMLSERDDARIFETSETAYITGMYSLDQIAGISGISPVTLRFLNPALRRGFTPAGSRYALRVPQGTASAVEEAMKSAGAPSDAITLKVQKGDSLWAISRRYGVTVADLCAVNNIKENGILSIGQTIIVPIME
ncbi:MAG: transglycosylase SLT domain-containing protein [Treponema sp.]|nr:transglycosylase SLT domain-containing protein [Treponema sp.]